MPTGFFLLAIALLPVVLDAQQQAGAPVRANVCDLLREPDTYNLKLVEIDARISWSDEGSVIFHQNCTGSILFSVSPQMDANTTKQYIRLVRLLKKTNVAAQLSSVFEHSDVRRWGHQAMSDSRLLTTAITRVRTAPRDKR